MISIPVPPHAKIPISPKKNMLPVTGQKTKESVSQQKKNFWLERKKFNPELNCPKNNNTLI